MTNTMAELVAQLVETVDELKNKTMPTDEANTIANLAGKVIAAQRIQVEYARARKELPDIKFMMGE